MKQILLSILSLCCLLTVVSCTNRQSTVSSGSGSIYSSADNKGMYQKITPEQAKEKMEQDPTIILVDVRTQAEYDQGHIQNAILIPNETIDSTKPAQLPDLDATILVYCRSGNRSKQAAQKLIAMGYTHVFDFGGINSWPYGTTK